MRNTHKSYAHRVIEKANYKIKHCGNLPNKNQHYGLYSGYLEKFTLTYPFKYSVQDGHPGPEYSSSTVITIKNNKKTNNLPGIKTIQEFLRPRIGHAPSIDELGEFISLYTIKHHQQSSITKTVVIKQAILQATEIALLASNEIKTRVDKVLLLVEELLETSQKQNQIPVLGNYSGGLDGEEVCDDWEDNC